MSEPGYRQIRYARPPGACEILLVRHGESEEARPDHPFPLVDGQGDPALHPTGEAQARRVAERLAGESIDAVYVSSLRRTRLTAAPLLAMLGVEPVVEPDLREVHLGEWEGAPTGATSPRATPWSGRCSPRSAGTSSPAPSPPRPSRPGCAAPSAASPPVTPTAPSWRSRTAA